MKIPEDLISSVVRSKTGAGEVNSPGDKQNREKPARASQTAEARAGQPALAQAQKKTLQANLTGEKLRIRAANRHTYSVPPEIAARTAYESSVRAPKEPASDSRERPAPKTNENRAQSESDNRTPADAQTARRREHLGVERGLIERKIAELRLKLAADSKKKADSVVADFDAKQKIRERKSLEREMDAVEKQIASIERERMANSRDAALNVAKSNLEAQFSASQKAGSVSAASTKINTVV